MPVVFCVLVNWNGWADTLACIASLLAQDYSALHVVIVDNGSTDGSAERIREAYPQVAVLETGANLGFARGTNHGTRYALQQGADFVWMLNNDTIVPSDTCSKLVSKAQQHPEAGMVGSVLYTMTAPRAVQAWGGGELSVWLGRSRHFMSPEEFGPTGYLTFASVLIPREVLYRVGVLYEGMFLYWEDGDYGIRVNKAGYKLIVAEDTAILHKEGASSGKKHSPRTDRYATASCLHFLRRHSPFPPLSMALFVAMKFLGRVLRGQPENAKAVWLGVMDYRRQRGITSTDQV